MSIRSLLLIVVLLVTTLISAVVARTELLAFIVTPSDSGVSVFATLSPTGNKKALDACVAELQEPEFLVLSTQEYVKVVNHCRDTAITISKRLPTYSYVWVLRGWTELLLQQDAIAVDAFKTSHVLNSKELWIAQFRLHTLLRLKPEFLHEPRLIEQNVSDVEVLIYGNRNWRLLAELWVNNEMKEPIAEMVKTLPTDIQQRFLRKIRQNFTSISES